MLKLSLERVLTLAYMWWNKANALLKVAVKFSWLATVCSLFLVAGNAVATQNKPALWQLSSQSSDYQCYLFATIHATTANQRSLPDYIHKAIEQSDTLLLETLITAQQSQQEFKQIAYASGGPLAWSSEVSLTVSALFESEQIEQLSHLKPWALGILISQARIKQQGFQLRSIDGEIKRIASAKQKTLLALEPNSQAMDVFRHWPDEGAALLSMVIASEQIAENKMQHIADIWQTADLNRLQELTDINGRQSAFAKQFQVKMLQQRNMAWLPVIEAELQRSHCFIAVGMMHFAQPNSLLDLLKKQEITVKRLN